MRIGFERLRETRGMMMLVLVGILRSLWEREERESATLIKCLVTFQVRGFIGNRINGDSFLANGQSLLFHQAQELDPFKLEFAIVVIG